MKNSGFTFCSGSRTSFLFGTDLVPAFNFEAATLKVFGFSIILLFKTKFSRRHRVCLDSNDYIQCSSAAVYV